MRVPSTTYSLQTCLGTAIACARLFEINNSYQLQYNRLTSTSSFLYIAAQMDARTKYESLPRPDHLHHIVEDTLTTWDAPISHILPLRRFLETVTNQDLRNFYAADCFEMAMLHQTVPLYCRQQYLKGAGIMKTKPLFYQS